MSNKERNRIPEEKTLREHFKNLRMPLEVWLALTHTHTRPLSSSSHSVTYPVRHSQPTNTDKVFFLLQSITLFSKRRMRIELGGEQNSRCLQLINTLEMAGFLKNKTAINICFHLIEFHFDECVYVGERAFFAKYQMPKS